MRSMLCRSRTPDSEGNDSSFHYDVRQLPSHADYSYHNHHVSEASADVSAEPTWKATGMAYSRAFGAVHEVITPDTWNGSCAKLHESATELL